MDDVPGLTFHSPTATHTLVDATGVAAAIGKSFASQHRHETVTVPGGVQFRLTLDAANRLRLKVKLGHAKVPRARCTKARGSTHHVTPTPIARAPSCQLSGLIGRDVRITPPPLHSPAVRLRALQPEMDLLDPTDAPHVQHCRKKVGVLPSGNAMIEEYTTVTFSLSYANTNESAAIILDDLARRSPGTGILPIVLAHDATSGQVDVTYPATLDLGLSDVEGRVYTIDAGLPTQQDINEANIAVGSKDEPALELLEQLIFSRPQVGFIFSRRADPTDSASDMHAGAVVKIGQIVYFADPHFTCTRREDHFGWLELVALKRGLIMVNLGTFTMQGEESTCMIHAVVLLLLMVQYLPNGGAPRYRDHPVAERYWYCLLVYMLFKREQIEDEIVGDASVTEQ